MNLFEAAEEFVKLLDGPALREMTPVQHVALVYLKDAIRGHKTYRAPVVSSALLANQAQDVAIELERRRDVTRRKSTLMRMAGNVAAGIVQSAHMPRAPRDVAVHALRIAENIVALIEMQPAEHAMKGREG